MKVEVGAENEEERHIIGRLVSVPACHYEIPITRLVSCELCEELFVCGIMPGLAFKTTRYNVTAPRSEELLENCEPFGHWEIRHAVPDENEVFLAQVRNEFVSSEDALEKELKPVRRADLFEHCFLRIIDKLPKKEVYRDTKRRDEQAEDLLA